MHRTHLVAPGCLVTVTRECFEGLGLSREDSAAIADVLVDANLRGMPSHGLQRLPAYMHRVHAGLEGGTERMRVVSEKDGLCRIDAEHALGPAAAVKAVQQAVALARRFGVSVVGVGGSSHFGCAGYYARMVADAGMVGLVMTNSVRRVVPHGARVPFVGTNPVAIGIPLPGRVPFVLDMASSIEAGGKIMRAKERGEPLPVGVALDRDGAPTTDASSALQGGLLPFAGPKGSGLALAISLLAVTLADADCDDVLASLHQDLDRPQNVGHVFIVIDFSRVASPGAMRRVDQMVDRLLDLTPIDGSPSVRYPGQAKEALAEQHRSHGMPIDEAELLIAAAACRNFGLDHVADNFLRLREAPDPVHS